MEIKLQYLVNTVALLSKNDETAGCVKGTKHRYLDSAIGICTIDKQKDRLVLHHRSMEVVKGHTQVNQAG